MRTVEQLSHDERRSIVRSWEIGTVISDKDLWVNLIAKEFDVQEDTIRLVLAEDS